MLKLKTGSNTGSDTLTRDPTRPGQIADPVPSLVRNVLSLKNCPFAWGSGPLSNTWFLGPNRVFNSNGISIGSAVFAGLTAGQTDRQTTLLVCNNRPRLRRRDGLIIYAFLFGRKESIYQPMPLLPERHGERF